MNPSRELVSIYTIGFIINLYLILLINVHICNAMGLKNLAQAIKWLLGDLYNPIGVSSSSPRLATRTRSSKRDHSSSTLLFRALRSEQLSIGTGRAGDMSIYLLDHRVRAQPSLRPSPQHSSPSKRFMLAPAPRRRACSTVYGLIGPSARRLPSSPDAQLNQLPAMSAPCPAIPAGPHFLAHVGMDVRSSGPPRSFELVFFFSSGWRGHKGKYVIIAIIAACTCPHKVQQSNRLHDIAGCSCNMDCVTVTRTQLVVVDGRVVRRNTMRKIASQKEIYGDLNLAR
jgi:hypothetical protein